MQLPEFLTEHRCGSLRLAGHPIALEHLVYFYSQGYSPEMILGQSPSLSPATIAFYLENQAAVDAYVQHGEGEVARQRATAPASPDLVELRRRAAQLSQSENR